MSDDIRPSVLALLQQLPTRQLDALKQLFWSELNYDRANEPLSTRTWPRTATEPLAEPPTLLATAGQGAGFNIIYCCLKDEHLLPGPQRPIISQLLNNHLYALFIFSNRDRTHWHFVNVRYEKTLTSNLEEVLSRRVFRRITIGPNERLRTAAERVSLLDIASLSPDLFGLSPLAIQQRHDEAFNVEVVTNQFFKGYQEIFREFQSDLTGQTGDARWSHDYALQFLNRVMFLYYVQRKRWLGNDPDFLANFWQAYQRAARPTNTFFAEWLSILFFEAFNNKFQTGRANRAYLPEPIRKALEQAPYLNGGLFTANELDRKHSPTITDGRFRQIFNFLEGYNFTISEDTPLDQEVAVDPEMIGKVYESLVNVSAEADERGEAGIFYTPRIEIDLMCRLALVDWLTNHIGESHKNLLYETVFALEAEAKNQADAALAEQNLWPQLDSLLRTVTLVDPACGSGSFLVGMLYVLDDLLARANQQLGRQETPYDRKKSIIGNSLYGVDVMDWAVHVAELRLWLQLVIDTDLHPAQLKFTPLLPNLSFKIRPGDSLVQEVGGLNLAVRHGSSLISAQMKGRINQLKGEKLKFYNNDPQCKYPSAQLLAQVELQLFRDLLDDRAKRLDDRLKEIEQALRPQVNLFGEVQTTQITLERPRLEQERDRLQAEREGIVRARQALKTVKNVPFVWDIAFVEVFEGDKAGFDLVIGNPPYVRQELIRDPHQPPHEVTPPSKQAYKEKLARSVYVAWPRTFNYDWTRGVSKWKLDAKSDLYIYFYFHGLSLLNEKGSFCFITSNSWLDVGYGRDLQEFLLTHGQVKLVLDNQARRSFASADVNTVILLLGPARDSRSPLPDSQRRLARFMMLTVPFEQLLDPVAWQEVEAATSRQTRPEYRLFPLSQADLLTSGLEPVKKQYVGDKWGGKYLRAPDIFWIIFGKGKNKLVRLSDIAEVRFGIKTGANNFFFLDAETVAYWNIEPSYLKPVLKSPREVNSILVDPSTLKLWLFVCNKAKNELKGTNALKYIEWGESQNLDNRPSTASRVRWWSIGDRRAAWLNCNYQIHHTMKFFVGTSPFFVSNNFHEIHTEKRIFSICASVNSTISQLWINTTGRTNLGGGLLKVEGYEAEAIPIVDPNLLDEQECKNIIMTGGLLELGSEGRRRLDEYVCSVIDLPLETLDEMECAIVEQVERRLRKADSI